MIKQIVMLLIVLNIFIQLSVHFLLISIFGIDNIFAFLYIATPIFPSQLIFKFL